MFFPWPGQFSSARLFRRTGRLTGPFHNQVRLLASGLISWYKMFRPSKYYFLKFNTSFFLLIMNKQYVFEDSHKFHLFITLQCYRVVLFISAVCSFLHKRDDRGFRGIQHNFFRKVGGFRGSDMECYMDLFLTFFLHELVVTCQLGILFTFKEEWAVQNLASTHILVKSKLPCNMECGAVSS